MELPFRLPVTCESRSSLSCAAASRNGPAEASLTTMSPVTSVFLLICALLVARIAVAETPGSVAAPTTGQLRTASMAEVGPMRVGRPWLRSQALSSRCVGSRQSRRPKLGSAPRFIAATIRSALARGMTTSGAKPVETANCASPTHSRPVRPSMTVSGEPPASPAATINRHRIEAMTKVRLLIRPSLRVETPSPHQRHHKV